MFLREAVLTVSFRRTVWLSEEVSSLATSITLDPSGRQPRDKTSEDGKVRTPLVWATSGERILAGPIPREVMVSPRLLFSQEC